jgi:hypothetical protein
MKLGIIAEDISDVRVLSQLTRRMVRPKKIGFKQFVGRGCGKIMRKCRAWAEILVRQGCLWVVVVHDCDRNEERALRQKLEEAIAGVNTRASIVLIPVREIETWLLFDPNAIASAFREGKKPRLPGNPESLQDPKKILGEIVWKTYRKQYLNTVHNEIIAKNLDPQFLNRARSFKIYPPFVSTLKQELR